MADVEKNEAVAVAAPDSGVPMWQQEKQGYVSNVVTIVWRMCSLLCGQTSGGHPCSVGFLCFLRLSFLILVARGFVVFRTNKMQTLILWLLLTYCS